ncbi:hypothetical protein EA187_09085 [Lujinxingia sediminis]|uniref:SMP-30/Gluconolactonase/LRE-like region domain-containing protein n=1 Tax=Lujinxingia sediminis TaxID=2480984 RepID=A0ABY0CVG3_9DELT|nr:hypothetical protein [Lujinxingia sediminis]RVU45901.1 hypothetical protein EA187_09085 [Lujinxingia sediminis]
MRVVGLKGLALLGASMMLAVGCGEGSQAECESFSDCSGETPWCAPEQTCEALPPGHQIGVGDGSPGTVILEEVYATERSMELTDLAFNPAEENELWLLRREHPSDEPCEEGNATAAGCGALEGSTTTIKNFGTADEEVIVKVDPNAWHFMRRPPAMAFGDNGFWATVGEERTANFLDGQADFMGPVLWSADLTIHGEEPPPGLNGSHFDMLHNAPYGMGIAHEVDNVYWVFNGMYGSLDRTDFGEDHGVGESDHTDGKVLRYVNGELSRVEGVPSHMKLDKETRLLYVADTGNSRIVRLNIDAGDLGAPITLPNYDGISVYDHMDGAQLEDIVPAGLLEQPSGLALHEGVMFVSDQATGKLHAFTLDGEHLRELDTGLGAGALAGIVISPVDGSLYLVHQREGKLYRVDVIL